MTRQSTELDEDIEAFRPHFRHFLKNEFTPHAHEWRRRKSVDPEVWPKLGRFGVLLPSIPEKYGGLGKSFAFDAAIIEDVEKIVPELTAGIVAQNTIVPHYLLRYASEAQKQRWLPRRAAGELISAIAITEPAAGSDLRAIGMRAERHGDRFVLNGQKTFITNGNIANLVLVAAKTNPSESSGDISMFVVETDNCAGFKRGRNLDKMGLHASGVSELFFADAAVDAECLLGGVAGQGLRQLMEQLPRERLVIAVVAVAAMEQAIDITVRYAKDRIVFGRPVLDFQANGFSLAEAKTQAVIARVFVDWCVERLVAGEFDAVTASMAKLWTTETQMSVIDTCLQLHGGNGYMDEYDISRMYTAARAQKIFGGTNEIMKHVIARSL